MAVVLVRCFDKFDLSGSDLSKNFFLNQRQSLIYVMATSMSDVTSPPGESNAGEESSMDDFVTMGPSNESSLQSPATFRNGSGKFNCR